MMTTRIFQTKDDRRNKLVDDLREIAIRTWNLMANGNSSGLSINEETITEINLLELKLRHPNSVFIKQVSKREEGKIGADWLWAFVGKDNKVFGMCVQAKRLFTSLLYSSIIENKADPGEQVNKLIHKASNLTGFTGKKLYPLYINYNTWDENKYKKADLVDNNCCEYNGHYERLGCAFVDAYYANVLIEGSRISLDDYLNFSHPWSCLIACTVRNPHSDLAKALCRRFVFRKINDPDMNDVEFNEADYLTSLEEAYLVRSVMLNEVNENTLIEMGVKGVVIIKQD